MSAAITACNALSATKIAKNKKTIFCIAAHIAFWAAFLSIPDMLMPRRGDMDIADVQQPPRWGNALYLVAVYYFNTLVAIPKFYFRRRYALLALSIIVVFSLFFWLHCVQAHPHLAYRSPGSSVSLFMFITIYAGSFIICLYRQYHRRSITRLNTRISFLMAQINPHFLFNTLNSIYSLSLLKPDKVSDAIVTLSGLMRYSVSEGNSDTTSLTKEIDYLRNYVELQKLRLTDKVTVSLTVTGNTDQVQIAPFVLIPFVENAFKHGVNTRQDSLIAITINATPQTLHLRVHNTKVAIRPDRQADSSLGIAATRQRLELLYPGKYTLHIGNEPDHFTVILQIQHA